MTVSISESSRDMAAAAERAALTGGYKIIVPAMDFTVTCTYCGQIINISLFSSYIERRILLPDDTDPSGITTALVVNPDATAYSVPTRVISSGGHHYAVISSLTNSTYALINNPVVFSDVADSWCGDAVNDLGSRLVITGTGRNLFSPDMDITRVEFSAIVVRALGLAPGTGAAEFSDVKTTDWFCGYIQAADAYGLITGFDNGTFRPNDTITREQAMTIIARAMTITGHESDLTSGDITAILNGFTDGSDISSYARYGVAECVKTGLVNGRNGLIDPDANITRAETAVIVQRLLQKAGLI
jgi:hypothetical protein